jgi:hypothetical protein
VKASYAGVLLYDGVIIRLILGQLGIHEPIEITRYRRSFDSRFFYRYTC